LALARSAGSFQLLSQTRVLFFETLVFAPQRLVFLHEPAQTLSASRRPPPGFKLHLTESTELEAVQAFCSRAQKGNAGYGEGKRRKPAKQLRST
jgi:hypothetical protein